MILNIFFSVDTKPNLLNKYFVAVVVVVDETGAIKGDKTKNPNLVK